MTDRSPPAGLRRTTADRFECLRSDLGRLGPTFHRDGAAARLVSLARLSRWAGLSLAATPAALLEQLYELERRSWGIGDLELVAMSELLADVWSSIFGTKTRPVVAAPDRSSAGWDTSTLLPSDLWAGPNS